MGSPSKVNILLNEKYTLIPNEITSSNPRNTVTSDPELLLEEAPKQMPILEELSRHYEGLSLIHI